MRREHESYATDDAEEAIDVILSIATHASKAAGAMKKRIEDLQSELSDARDENKDLRARIADLEAGEPAAPKEEG